MHRAYKVKLEVEDWQSPWWLVGGCCKNTSSLRPQIGLNTNLLYHSDHLSEGQEDPGSQLAFLLEALLMVASFICSTISDTSHPHSLWF